MSTNDIEQNSSLIYRRTLQEIKCTFAASPSAVHIFWWQECHGRRATWADDRYDAADDDRATGEDDAAPVDLNEVLILWWSPYAVLQLAAAVEKVATNRNLQSHHWKKVSPI